ncbi:MAG: hypothetical protein ACRCYC_02935 [Paraclostridium sp.]|uniref:hypothetical protein n=1 Tax=Paraclostridium sp. TaxID=2023273 RepID=UPI003F2C8B9C
MNKILTLYNIEFKRIYKLYFALIGMLFIGNIGGVVKSLYDSIAKISNENNIPMNLDILNTSIGFNIIKQFTVKDIYIYGSLLLGICVLMCLIYSLIIWYRDYYSKSKTIYTLLSLPQPRFNIYLSKLITIVVMIYGLIVFQFLFWYIDLNIVKIMADISSPSFTNIYTNMMQLERELNIVSPYIIEFLMIDVVGVILAVVVVFTCVLLERAFRKIGILLGITYVLLSLIGYICIIGVNSTNFRTLLISHIIYYIVLFTLSIFISYRLINKRIFIEGR